MVSAPAVFLNRLRVVTARLIALLFCKGKAGRDTSVCGRVCGEVAGTARARFGSIPRLKQVGPAVGEASASPQRCLA